jgi:hypothetical protein
MDTVSTPVPVPSHRPAALRVVVPIALVLVAAITVIALLIARDPSGSSTPASVVRSATAVEDSPTRSGAVVGSATAAEQRVVPAPAIVQSANAAEQGR